MRGPDALLGAVGVEPVGSTGRRGRQRRHRAQPDEPPGGASGVAPSDEVEGEATEPAREGRDHRHGVDGMAEPPSRQRVDERS
jgi:hypothetical protein